MSSLTDQYNSVKTNVGLFDFSIEGKIKITGKGRITFINGLVSNEVENLEENNGVYAAFLNRFGKILTDCMIYKFKDFLLLNMSLLGKKNVIERLKNEAPLGKSQAEDISMKYGLFSIQGPKSLELINAIFDGKIKPDEYQNTITKNSINDILNNNDEKSIKNNQNNKQHSKEDNEIIITKNERTPYEGYDIFFPAVVYNDLKKLILEKGVQQISHETYNILRLEAKIPLFGIDFDETNILPEVTEKAVDYEKGCFVGQEIVARVKNIAKGKTAKKLMFFEIDSDSVPKVNTKITQADNDVGFITSSAFSPEKNKTIAFGFVRKGQSDKFLVDGKIATNQKL